MGIKWSSLGCAARKPLCFVRAINVFLRFIGCVSGTRQVNFKLAYYERERTSETAIASLTASLKAIGRGFAVSGLKLAKSRRLCTVRPPERTRIPSFLCTMRPTRIARLAIGRCIPQFSHGFPGRPIPFGTQRTVNGSLNYWNVLVFCPKHKAEGHEYSMI